MLAQAHSITFRRMSQTTQTPRTYQTEGDEIPVYPEQRLWTAVLLFSIQEYEEHLIRMWKVWEADRRPISKHFLSHIRGIKYEIQHEWFQHICDMAGRDHRAILWKLKQLELKHRFSEIKFSDQDTSVSRYQLRRMRRFESKGTR